MLLFAFSFITNSRWHTFGCHLLPRYSIPFMHLWMIFKHKPCNLHQTNRMDKQSYNNMFLFRFFYEQFFAFDTNEFTFHVQCKKLKHKIRCVFIEKKQHSNFACCFSWDKWNWLFLSQIVLYEPKWTGVSEKE